VRRWRSRFLVALLLAASACGSSSGQAVQRDGVTLTVLAAASLNQAFPRIGVAFTRENPSVTVRFSFAGTDSVATQIEQGAPADVFAGASTRYGDQLGEAGLTEAHRTLCTNSLVLVVPDSNPAGIGSLEELSRPGVKLVIAAESVPAGTYTRIALANLDAILGDGYSRRVLGNVVSNEENVEAVMTKVRLGEADAGFSYVTNARAAGSAVRTIGLPPEAQVVVSYPIAVVTASAHPRVAQRFVDFVLGTESQRILREAGFGPPPS
jgi:molybdate transport system substrate-binding protein